MIIDFLQKGIFKVSIFMGISSLHVFGNMSITSHGAFYYVLTFK